MDILKAFTMELMPVSNGHPNGSIHGIIVCIHWIP